MKRNFVCPNCQSIDIVFNDLNAVWDYKNQRFVVDRPNLEEEFSVDCRTCGRYEMQTEPTSNEWEIIT